MKLLFIVLDGLGDLRVKGHPTPCDNPKLTTMHSLAKKGITGIVYTVPGVAPESDSAVFSLLGYDLKEYTGRGPLEAVGLGMNFKPGVVALRCNFSTYDGNKVVDRRAGRTLTNEQSAALAKALNKNIKLKDASFVFRAGIAHRGVLLLKSKKKLDSRITFTDPAYKMTSKGVPEALHGFKSVLLQSKPMVRQAAFTAKLLNDFTMQSFHVMDGHSVNKQRRKARLLPANIILSRDAGSKVPKIKSISKRFNRKWAILADMPMEMGIAKLAGMGIVNLPVPSFKAKDYPPRVKKTLEAMKKYDCLYIHIKGPDLYGHDGDFEGKKRSVEDIENCYFRPLLKKINMEDTIICVTADHSTPCILKGHSKDPVPIMVSGGNIKPDKVAKFSEAECRKGSIGVIKGIDIMPLLKKLLEK